MTVNPEPAGPPAPQGKSSKRSIGCLVIVLLGIAALAVFGWMQSQKSPDVAKVGDCVARAGSDDLEIVKCTDPKAAYKVAGKVDNKTQTEVSINSSSICKPFAGAQSAYWRGEVGKKGYVLCLAPAK